MSQKKLLAEKDLAALARRFRKQTGKTRAEAGRELGVSHVSIHRAEENPDISLLKLRMRMIEAYSQFKVIGPVFHLESRQKTRKA
jgi:DNA-binding XRE family transcriptional regulator